MFLTYYGFLAAGLVLLAAFRGSTVLSEPRSAQLSYLLVPPLILLMLVLNLGLLGTVLLTVVLIVITQRFLRRYAHAAVNRDTLYYFLGLWLLQAIVPAAIHFALRSRPDSERWSLLISAVVLLLASILLLTVWAPDVRKKA